MISSVQCKTANAMLAANSTNLEGVHKGFKGLQMFDSTQRSYWEKQSRFPTQGETQASRDTQRQRPYHSHRVPIIGLQPIVVPCGDTPQGGVPIQQHGCRLEEVQEVWAEEHVILHNDDMAVALLQEHPIQGPLVVLGQPSMPRLHPTAQHPSYVMLSLKHHPRVWGKASVC